LVDQEWISNTVALQATGTSVGTFQFPACKATWTPPGETNKRALFGIVQYAALDSAAEGYGLRHSVALETWTTFLLSLDPIAVFAWLAHAQPETAEGAPGREVPTVADLFIQWTNRLIQIADNAAEEDFIDEIGLDLHWQLSEGERPFWFFNDDHRGAFNVTKTEIRDKPRGRFADIEADTDRGTILSYLQGWMDYALDPLLRPDHAKAAAISILQHRTVLRQLDPDRPPGWIDFKAFVCADCAQPMARPAYVRCSAADARAPGMLLCAACGHTRKAPENKD
jgi:hypothetical protein